MAPRLAEHEDDYLAHVRRMREGVHREIEHDVWEDSTHGNVERNILRSCVFPPRFSLKGMDKLLPMKTLCVAKGGDERGLGNIKNGKTHGLTFRTPRIKMMQLSRGVADYSQSYEPWDPSDRVMQNVQAAMCGVGPDRITPLNTATISGRFSRRQDMRLTFLKGYLYLCDYTLAHSSRNSSKFEGRFDTDMCENITPQARLSALVSREVVIDVGCMSRDEVRLLAMMGSSYPVVKYGADNVYNTHRIEKDDMVLVSSERIDVSVATSFTSPDHMYTLMTDLATKLDVLDDLREVLSGYRGVPFLIDHHSAVTNRTNYLLKYCSPRHLRCAFECRPSGKVSLVKRSNYYSSTISVVCDALMGQCYQLGVLGLVEGLGATAVVGMPTDQPRKDIVFNDQLRNYGLKHDSSEINALLMEWETMVSMPMPVALSSLKDYVVEWTNDLVAGGWVWQGLQSLGLCIPATYFQDSSLGSQRGWSANPVICGDEQISAAAQTKAFGFIMGVSDVVPRLLPSVGDYLTVPELSGPELEMMMGRSGNYTIRGLWISVGCDVRTYTDRMEVSLMSFHGTRYKGCGFYLAYDPETGGERMAVHSIELEDVARILDTLGLRAPEDKSEEEFETYTFGGSTKRREDRVGDVGEIAKIRISDVPVTPSVGKGYSIGLPLGKAPGLERADRRRPPVQENQVGEIERGFFEYQTRGDGTCGVHAIVQDLAVHGFIEPKNYTAAHRSLNDEALNKDWHTEPDLALLATSRGFGLQAVSKAGDGWVARNYGTEGAPHVVRLRHENGHWSNIVPGTKPWTGGFSMEGGTNTADRAVSDMEKLKRFFA